MRFPPGVSNRNAAWPSHVSWTFAMARRLASFDQQERLDGLALALDREGGERLGDGRVPELREGPGSDEHLARLGGALEARCEVCRVADRREAQVLGAADVPDQSRPGVDTDAEARPAGVAL